MIENSPINLGCLNNLECVDIRCKYVLTLANQLCEIRPEVRGKLLRALFGVIDTRKNGAVISK